MVVRLVLKHQHPIPFLTVHIYRNADRAGVDLFGFVQVWQLARRLERLRADRRQIHERHRLVLAPCVEPFAQLQIGLIALLDIGRRNLRPGEDRAKGGMAAVIRPIGVDEPQFRHCGAAPLPAEIFLAEPNVTEIHGQSIFLDHPGEACLV